MASVNIASSDNITGIRLKEQASSPTTPPSGYAQLYVNTTPAVQFEDDAGTVRTLSDTTHTHAAADITSGTLDNARVNWASPSAIGATTASTLRGTTLALTSTNNMLSALIPNADNTLDLGSATNRWNDVYAGVGRFNQITQPVDTITTITGSYERNTLSSTYTPSADSAAFISSTRFNTTISNAFNHTLNGVNGVYSTLTHSGVGTTTTARNLYAITTFSAGTVSAGFGINVNNVASGSTMTSNRGVYVLMSTTGGTVTTSRGVEVVATVTGGTIGEANGIYIGNMGNALVTTSKALLIDNQTGSVTNQSLVTLGGDVIINENGTTSIFRVESDTNANMLYVDGTNNRVGIGTSSPTRTLEVNGTIGSATTYSTTITSNVRDLQIDDTGNLGYVASARKHKHKIRPIKETNRFLAKLRQLNPVRYRYKVDGDGDGVVDDLLTHYGFVAEEVEEVFPELCSYDIVPDEGAEIIRDEEGKLDPSVPTHKEIATLNYSEMHAIAIAGLQHALDKIDELEAKVRDLERRLVRLEVRA